MPFVGSPCKSLRAQKKTERKQQKKINDFFLPYVERLAKSINKEINYCFSNSTTAANTKKSQAELFYAETKQTIFCGEKKNLKTWKLYKAIDVGMSKKLFNLAAVTPLLWIALLRQIQIGMKPASQPAAIERSWSWKSFASLVWSDYLVSPYGKGFLQCCRMRWQVVSFNENN